MSRSGIYDLKYGFIPDDDVPQEPPKRTNADRITDRAMEEMAETGGSMNEINTNSYTLSNNYSSSCYYRLPCGICTRTNSMCPLYPQTITVTCNGVGYDIALTKEAET